MWMQEKKKISKEDFEAINAGKKSVKDFFSVTEICGYGAIPRQPYEKDGEYFIPYGISDSCD